MNATRILMLAGAVTGAAGFMRRDRDRFNPETGAYEFEKGGRGRERVTFGNVAGNLPLIGTAAALGVAFGSLLNDATGLSGKLAGLALVPAEGRSGLLATEKPVAAVQPALSVTVTVYEPASRPARSWVVAPLDQA